MAYLNMHGDYFRNELTDRFRSPHLWTKDSTGSWKPNTVAKNGIED